MHMSLKVVVDFLDQQKVILGIVVSVLGAIGGTIFYRITRCGYRRTLTQHLFRPLLRAVQHPQDAHGVAVDAIRCDVRRSANDQLAGAINTTKAARLGELEQLADLGANPIIHDNGSTRAVFFDVIENPVPIL
jgi:hypothetical protein